MARLEVDIDANIQGLQTSIDQATKAATKLGNPFAKTVGVINTLNQRAAILRKNLEGATDIKSIAKYNLRLQETQNELQRIKGLGTQSLASIGRSAQMTAGGMNALSRSTSTYNGVGIEFSRIIQDAPFGILGVGNNITRLAETFQQLRSQSVSTGAAVKTALASIISPANLLVLGISAVTTAFTLYSMGAFGSKKATKEAKDELEEYRKTLNTVALANIEGSQNAEKEIQSFELLRAQAENTNVPLNKRIDAVNEMQKQFPSYLGNLTKEQILTGNVGDAYGELTKSIIATAKARAFSDKIAENSIKLLTLEEKTQQKTSDIIEAREKLERAKQASLVSGAKLAGQFTAVDTAVIDAQDDLNKLINEQISDVAQIGSINTENLKLQENITSQIEQGAIFTSDTVSKTKELTKSWKETEDSIIDAIKANIRFNELTDQKKQFEQMTGRLTGKEGEDADALRITSLENAIALSLETSGQPVDEFVDKLEEKTDKVKSLAAELSGAFGGVGSAISAAFGQSPAFGQFLGQFLSFATKLIAANFSIASSNAIVGATSAAVATGPAAPLTLGAFIAGAVGLVGAAFAAIKSGGGSSGGGSGGGGVSGVKSISYTGTGMNSQSVFSNVTFTIEGTTLKGVLERTENRFSKG